MPDNAGRRAQHVYIAIDLKSFYASVECRERDLDPLSTNLVVADASRSEKTICLAVSPSLKSYGISGRARLFEVIERVRQINAERRSALGGRPFRGESADDVLVRSDPTLMLSYITAMPHMARYMQVSSSIYDVYLRYAAPEDIHVYSIDEVFMDVTPYLGTYRTTARELAGRIIEDVLAATGITATAGIGTNMYLCKVAMDIVAKHISPDENGARIAELDEASYRRQLWTHRPLTDFWRVGHGYARRLEANGMHTMGDVARRSIADEDSLYAMFGVNAEYLIDHAWGVEPTTMAQVHAYRPKSNSLSSGQVLPRAYAKDECRVVVREMADALSLDLVAKGLVTDHVALMIGYDAKGLSAGAGAGGAGATGGGRSVGRAATPGGEGEAAGYDGPVSVDRYGRAVPAHAQGSATLGRKTSSTRLITAAVLSVFDREVDPALPIRRINVVALDVEDESRVEPDQTPRQLDLFTDYEQLERQRAQERRDLERERSAQEQIIEIKRKFGKNAILKASSLTEPARARERNEQIGGHRA
ncbi:MAG: DNA repair protein [Coriobacteriales bacterium]|jgi:DNA polymerase V